MTWGVDYGSVDGNAIPNADTLAKAGASFVSVRGSYSWYEKGHQAWHLVEDTHLIRDWDMWGRHGFVRMPYAFPVLQATQSPAEQMNMLYQAVTAAGGLRKGVDLPPCLDIEFPGTGIAATGKTRAEIMQWIRDAVAELRRLFGCWPFIYTSGRVWDDHDADCLAGPPAADLTLCPLWLAHYDYQTRKPAVIPPSDSLPPPKVPSPWGDEWHFHQDQGDALGVPGFSSTVDVDRMRPAAKVGSRGGYVLWGQRKLAIAADGVFGPHTEAAVRAFQSAHGLSSSGVLDLATIAALAWV